jgi:hypothetical protein
MIYYAVTSCKLEEKQQRNYRENSYLYLFKLFSER